MIVVGGESLVDLLVEAEGEVTASPGGGPYNVARGLARLGAPAAFLGALSTDRFGGVLRAGLAADGVDLRWAVATERPTTLALAEMSPDGAAYRFYCEGTAAPSLSDTSAVPVPDALHVGALGLVLEPMATALEALVDRVAGQALVMVDPNWRPAARPDRQRILRVMAQADVVKVSTEDLAHMAIGDARALLTGRTRHVLVTDGPAPVRALSAGGELTMPVPAVAVVDTVGAGDAFCAGFLAAWTTNPDLEAALRLATKVSAVTCTRRGADPPRRDAL